MNRASSLDIINTIIQAISYRVEIKDYANNADGTHDLHVCNMYHAQVGFTVTIDGKNYKIIEILAVDKPDCKRGNWDFMKIRGDADDIEVLVFDLYRPVFVYGTPIQQGVENDKVGNAYLKTPMFWVNQGTLNTKLLYDETVNKEREMDFEIFALTQSDHAMWLSKDFQKNAVKPMERMLGRFFDQIKAMPWLFDQYSLSYDVKPYQRFGVYISNKGFEKSLWNDKLSGAGSPSSSVTAFWDDNGCVLCCKEEPYVIPQEESES